ncbi:MAG: hypothetical protein LBD12_04305, partial [Clostridiales Family XIII bacterium]|nr:hypothetical protein [Clostridiales Family XIII bacterium]
EKDGKGETGKKDKVEGAGKGGQEREPADESKPPGASVPLPGDATEPADSPEDGTQMTELDAAFGDDGARTDLPSGIVFIPLDIEGGVGMDGQDAYQPWRAADMDRNAVPYRPPVENGAAGATAATMGGLLLLGGAMRYLFLRLGL